MLKKLIYFLFMIMMSFTAMADAQFEREFDQYFKDVIDGKVKLQDFLENNNFNPSHIGKQYPSCDYYIGVVYSRLHGYLDQNSAEGKECLKDLRNLFQQQSSVILNQDINFTQQCVGNELAGLSDLFNSINLMDVASVCQQSQIYLQKKIVNDFFYEQRRALMYYRELATNLWGRHQTEDFIHSDSENISCLTGNLQRENVELVNNSQNLSYHYDYFFSSENGPGRLKCEADLAELLFHDPYAITTEHRSSFTEFSSQAIDFANRCGKYGIKLPGDFKLNDQDIEVRTANDLMNYIVPNTFEDYSNTIFGSTDVDLDEQIRNNLKGAREIFSAYKNAGNSEFFSTLDGSGLTDINSFISESSVENFKEALRQMNNICNEEFSRLMANLDTLQMPLDDDLFANDQTLKHLREKEKELCVSPDVPSGGIFLWSDDYDERICAVLTSAYKSDYVKNGSKTCENYLSNNEIPALKLLAQNSEDHQCTAPNEIPGPDKNSCICEPGFQKESERRRLNQIRCAALGGPQFSPGAQISVFDQVANKIDDSCKKISASTVDTDSDCSKDIGSSTFSSNTFKSVFRPSSKQNFNLEDLAADSELELSNAVAQIPFNEIDLSDELVDRDDQTSSLSDSQEKEAVRVETPEVISEELEPLAEPSTEESKSVGRVNTDATDFNQPETAPIDRQVQENGNPVQVTGSNNNPSLEENPFDQFGQTQFNFDLSPNSLSNNLELQTEQQLLSAIQRTDKNDTEQLEALMSALREKVGEEKFEELIKGEFPENELMERLANLEEETRRLKNQQNQPRQESDAADERIRSLNAQLARKDKRIDKLENELQNRLIEQPARVQEDIDTSVRSFSINKPMAEVPPTSNVAPAVAAQEVPSANTANIVAETPAAAVPGVATNSGGASAVTPTRGQFQFQEGGVVAGAEGLVGDAGTSKKVIAFDFASDYLPEILGDEDKQQILARAYENFIKENDGEEFVGASIASRDSSGNVTKACVVVNSSNKNSTNDQDEKDFLQREPSANDILQNFELECDTDNAIELASKQDAKNVISVNSCTDERASGLNCILFQANKGISSSASKVTEFFGSIFSSTSSN